MNKRTILNNNKIKIIQKCIGFCKLLIRYIQLCKLLVKISDLKSATTLFMD